MNHLEYRLLHALVDEVCNCIYHGMEPSENTVEVLRAAFSSEYVDPAERFAINALRVVPEYKDKLDELLGED